MPQASMLAGLRVLVVDDEWLSAYEVERLVHKLDCVVLGPAASVNGALDVVADDPPDLALLDVHLKGGTLVSPLVETLRARKVKYVLITSYSAQDLVEVGLATAPVVPKPPGEARLTQAIAQALQAN
jgi:two-component SAPR family response regulator